MPFQEPEAWVFAARQNQRCFFARFVDDGRVLLHGPLPYATVLTKVEGGKLEMAHQTAAHFRGRMAHLGFGGTALEQGEGERIGGAQRGNPDADIRFSRPDSRPPGPLPPLRYGSGRAGLASAPSGRKAAGNRMTHPPMNY